MGGAEVLGLEGTGGQLERVGEEGKRRGDVYGNEKEECVDRSCQFCSRSIIKTSRPVLKRDPVQEP